jgi:hypothetical protein
MTKPKISEVKSVISKIEKIRRRNASLLMPTRLGPSAEETKEYLKLLTPLFTKAGLDVDKFNTRGSAIPRREWRSTFSSAFFVVSARFQTCHLATLDGTEALQSANDSREICARAA